MASRQQVGTKGGYHGRRHIGRLGPITACVSYLPHTAGSWASLPTPSTSVKEKIFDRITKKNAFDNLASHVPTGLGLIILSRMGIKKEYNRSLTLAICQAYHSTFVRRVKVSMRIVSSLSLHAFQARTLMLLRSGSRIRTKNQDQGMEQRIMISKKVRLTFEFYHPRPSRAAIPEY